MSDGLIGEARPAGHTWIDQDARRHTECTDVHGHAYTIVRELSDTERRLVYLEGYDEARAISYDLGMAELAVPL